MEKLPETKNEIHAQELGKTSAGKEANSQLRDLIAQTLFTRAAELARSGRYTDAEKLLGDLEQDGENPAVMDLKARIFSQQGRFVEAEALWLRASQLEPGNKDYNAGLECLGRTRGRPEWIFSVRTLLIVLVIVLCIAVVGIWLKSYAVNLQDSVRTQIAGIKINPAVITQPQAQKKSPEVKINVSGVSFSNDGESLLAKFDSGLFSSNNILKPEAQKILSAFGRQLEPYIGRITLHIIGCTDDAPMPGGREYKDNIALGLSRAVAAAEFLRENTKIPANMYLTSGLGDGLAPFPNDTKENRLRNRTVIIRVFNAEK